MEPSYQVILSSQADGYIKRLPAHWRRRMATTIGRLETDRSIAEPLRGPLKGKFCVKEHPYRIILSIDSEARKVYIEDVGPRGDIYKK